MSYFNLEIIGFFVALSLVILYFVVLTIKFIWYKILKKKWKYTEYNECTHAMVKIDKDGKKNWVVITKGSKVEKREAEDKSKIILLAQAFREGTTVKIYLPNLVEN